MARTLNTNHEQHPLFPSGEWEGFYKYNDSRGTQHNMEFALNFCQQVVTGFGADNVGPFDWEGKYDTHNGTCVMTKFYLARHAVIYDGNVDENGIWGKWNISPYCSGVFHIWPKKKNTANETAAEEVVLEAMGAHLEVTPSIK